MSKIIQPLLFIATGAALVYYGYKVLKDAWENPPEEERCYSSSVAAIMDGADIDDEWILEQEDWQ